MHKLSALVLSSLFVLGGCATAPEPRCELAQVPSGAVFGVRHGLDTATYPPKIPRDLTGCQRVWYGDRQRPEAMQVLATYYFDRGQVRRLVGRMPGTAVYDCHYRDGVLDATRSQNAGMCPKASEIEPSN